MIGLSALACAVYVVVHVLTGYWRQHQGSFHFIITVYIGWHLAGVSAMSYSGVQMREGWVGHVVLSMTDKSRHKL